MSSSALKAASKASSMMASASGSNTPGVTKERIDITASPGRARVNCAPLTCHNQVKISAMGKTRPGRHPGRACLVVGAAVPGPIGTTADVAPKTRFPLPCRRCREGDRRRISPRARPFDKWRTAASRTRPNDAKGNGVGRVTAVPFDSLLRRTRDVSLPSNGLGNTRRLRPEFECHGP